jgi:hypothetical protein
VAIDSNVTTLARIVQWPGTCGAPQELSGGRVHGRVEEARGFDVVDGLRKKKSGRVA